jgi:ribosomal protein S18 acetylase RimI-like enzyme
VTPVAADRWLSGVLGVEVFRVSDASPAAAPALRRQIADRHDAFYFAKVATTDIDRVRTLRELGFDVVDVNMTFAAPPTAVVAAAGAAPGVEVTAAQASQRDAVLDIAGSCFRYSRFHLDPQVGAAAAHAVKREWIRSYFDGRRGDRLFVASVGGRPAGFLAALTQASDGTTSAVIDLIGVAADRQRSGVGRALVHAFARHYAGAGELVVGTQAANIPSIRMYEAFGFRAVASAFVLHRHATAGLPA